MSASEVPLPSPAVAPSALPAWPRARGFRWLLTLLLALMVAAAGIGLWAYHTLPRRLDRQQTFVFGQTQFAPGREGAVRILVRDAQAARAVPNAAVKVSLVPQAGGAAVTLFSGRSDENGTVGATFQIPESAAVTQTLVVEAQSSAGRDRVQQPVTVQRSYKLLVSTDKPVYQPGQTIHLRALAFSTLDMRAAAGAEIGFLVQDPKGSKVFRRAVQSSPFGIAAADFTLADEVTSGDYKVTASLGDTSSEKTVSVKPYVLPKFAARVTAERPYYLPGEHVAGTVQCDYFFGKPVAAAQVQIVGTVFDVQETKVVDIRGQTDAQGTYRFEFDLPRYFAGRGLETDQAEFSLQASIVDQAQHAEQASKVLPIARDPIAIEVVPEGGVLKPGVENHLFILTSYPNGQPAPTRLQVSLGGQTVQLDTREFNLAQYAIVPGPGPLQVEVTATDLRGVTAHKLLELKADQGPGVVLLRPDRATYRVGDTMRLLALTTENWGSLFLDVVKDGQTLSTRSLPIADGRAEAAIDLGGDLFGTLVLHAYKVLADGSIIRDTRIVVVDAPRDVSTAIQADREVYRPGETARLSFRTQTAAGPVPAALGVAIVDESVFAVMEQDPGFARLYFLLQKELLEPSYEVHGFTLPEVLTPTHDSELREAQDGAVRAAWAPLPAAAPPMNVNTRPLKIEAAAKARSAGLGSVANLILVALVLLPLGLWAAAIVGLHATGILGRAFGRLGLALLTLAFGSPLACIGLSLLLSLLSSTMPYDIGRHLVVLVLAGLVLAWLAAVVGLAVYAWRRRDERARLVWLLLGAWLALGIALTVALALGASPNGWLAALAVLAYLVGLLALLLFGFGLQAEGRRWAGAFTIATVLLFVPAMIGAATLPDLVQYARVIDTLGNPAVYVGPVGWLSGCAAGPGGDAIRSLPIPPLAGLMGGAAAPKTAGEAPLPGPAPAAPKASAAPRLRQFFPETLLWVPELATDAGGFVSLDVPLADSITTWRVTALASTQDGHLGYTSAALRVFQDLFVDVDLPVALTQNDELAIPVAVYNYLPDPQEVRLEVAPGTWFELQDEPAKALQIAANDVEVAYFRIKVTAFGEQAFQVIARGERASDAIRRTVTVLPDGRLFREPESDWLREGAAITATIPAQAIAGTGRIEVKIYPGAVSQVVEGLDQILRLPHGCFEQSSSSTYPNVLILGYLKATQTASPEVQMRAESYVGTGYQRMLTFEALGGGFSLFGGALPEVFLSAYGLHQLADMSRVYPVDQAVTERTARWLLGQQSADGSWAGWGYHENVGGRSLGMTAYVAWALADAGFGREAGVEKALAYLRQHAGEATDPYPLALVANALVAADPKAATTAQALDQLAALATSSREGAYWGGEGTMMGGYGRSGAVECTTLAVHALIRGGRHLPLAQQGLSFIVQSKDSWGTWGSTQATIWSLKALLLAASAGDVRAADATVRVALNGGSAQDLRFTPENADVVRVLTFEGGAVRPGENTVALEVSGRGPLMYQVTAIYYLPWAVAPPEPAPAGLMEVQVTYDRTTLAVNDLVDVAVQARLARAGIARTVLLDLGVPPGFTVLAEDLQGLVERKAIARYELTGRQVIVYVEDVSSEKPITFTYRLRARFPLRAKTQPGAAYDYYNPDPKAVVQPVEMTVQ